MRTCESIRCVQTPVATAWSAHFNFILRGPASHRVSALGHRVVVARAANALADVARSTTGLHTGHHLCAWRRTGKLVAHHRDGSVRDKWERTTAVRGLWRNGEDT